MPFEVLLKYPFVLLTGFLVTFVLTPLVQRIAPAIGMVDHPRDRHEHAPRPRRLDAQTRRAQTSKPASSIRSMHFSCIRSMHAEPRYLEVTNSCEIENGNRIYFLWPPVHTNS